MLESNNTPAIIEIYTRKGLISREKSYLAYEKETNKIKAIGSEAENFIDDASVLVVNPFEQGIVKDFIVAQKMTKYFMKKNMKKFYLKKPKVAVAHAREYSEIDEKALGDMVCMSGAGEIVLLNDSVEIPDGGYVSFLKYSKCEMLINITQDEPLCYVTEKAEALKIYAERFGITNSQLGEMIEASSKVVQNKYPVITLCGSTRFKKEFMDVQKKLTFEGNIVISVGMFGHSGDQEVWDNMDEGTLSRTKMMLDDMHKRKIDMADSIFVINVGGYIGDSTRSEIEYAKEHGKKIQYLEQII